MYSGTNTASQKLKNWRQTLYCEEQVPLMLVTTWTHAACAHTANKVH